MSLCKLSRCYNFNDNFAQSLIRTYLTLSLAKTQGSLFSANTQGSVYVCINQQILLNYFIYIQVKMKLTGLARLGQNTDNQDKYITSMDNIDRIAHRYI